MMKLSLFFKKNPQITDIEGWVVTDDSDAAIKKVYVIENGKKHWIQTNSEFLLRGYVWKDVKSIPQNFIEKIPDGTDYGRCVYDFRADLTCDLLKGRGMEIGAGSCPHVLPDGTTCEYFDKRNSQELEQYFDKHPVNKITVHPLSDVYRLFPKGADFLIAHNVLEHCPNPIKELIEWHSYVHEDGLVIISVPYRDFCPDRGRQFTTFEHIVDDFLNERDDNSFESKEHIFSNITGWIDEGCFKGLDKFEVAKVAFECVNTTGNDIHWHVFSSNCLLKCIQFSLLSQKMWMENIITTGPDQINPVNDYCEILMVYRIRKIRDFDQKSEFIHEVKTISEKLCRADMIMKRLVQF